MSSRKAKLPFDKRGGVLVISRFMREQPVYETMPATAKVLMDLLQMQWRNDRPIDFSVREAAKKICCSLPTAVKAFKALQDRGFIVCVTESLFLSQGGSKARSWRLTWMPFYDAKPTNDWEKWKAIKPSNKINSTVQKCTTLNVIALKNVQR